MVLYSHCGTLDQQCREPPSALTREGVCPCSFNREELGQRGDPILASRLQQRYPSMSDGSAEQGALAAVPTTPRGKGMRIIGNDWSDLEAGYRLMIAKDAELRQIQKAGIESARQAHYAAEQRAWDAAEQEREGRRIQANKRSRIVRRGGGVSMIAGIIMIFSAIPLASVPIFLIGLLVLGGGAVAICVKSPQMCPEYYPRSVADVAPLLNVRIVQRWWDGLSTGVRSMGNDGDEGERLLIAGLRRVLPDSYLCMRGLLVAPKLDADVIVIGPSGLWVLDSKYWTGSIIVRDGQWTRRKWYFERGGYETYRDEPITHHFDRQVEKEVAAVRATIARRVFRPDAHAIQMWRGVIFTHPDVSLDIDESWENGYGTVADCARWMRNADAELATQGSAGG